MSKELIEERTRRAKDPTYLRELARWWFRVDVGLGADISCAASEIEDLRKALKKLVDAADLMGDTCNSGIADEAIREARALLALPKKRRTYRRQSGD